MNKPVLPVSSLSLKLPKADRGIETYRLAASRTFPSRLEGTLNRVAFSAAHVVSDSMADLAGIDPAFGEGREGEGQRAGVFRGRHRSPRGGGCQKSRRRDPRL